jgi:hypothetical protein
LFREAISKTYLMMRQEIGLSNDILKQPSSQSASRTTGSPKLLSHLKPGNNANQVHACLSAYGDR